MPLRASHAAIAAPLIVGAIVVVLLLPGGTPGTIASVDRILAARTNGPTSEPIAVARVGTALPTPVPLSETAPRVTPGAAVPNAATVPLSLPTDTTAAVEPQTTLPKDGKPSFVGGRAVNLRVGPSKDTASLAVLQPGAAVKVLDESEGWTYVSTASGDTGWVSSGFVGANAPPPKAAETPKTEDNPSTGGNVIRTGGPVTVWARPSTSADTLFVVEAGEEMRIAETRGSWARVVVSGGRSGWVRVRRAN